MFFLWILGLFRPTNVPNNPVTVSGDHLNGCQLPLPQVDIGALGLHQVCPGGHFREKWWVTDENGNILYGGSFMILMLFDSTATCEGNGIFKYYEGCFMLGTIYIDLDKW
jgi:hypothetical protein